MNEGKWAEVSKSFLCPACGKADWCTVAPDRTGVLCRRVASQQPRPDRSGGNAWYHPIAGTTVLAAAKKLPAKTKANPLTRSELSTMQKQFVTAMSPARLDRASKEFNIPAASLVAFGIGSSPVGYTFPMYNGRRQLCGFRQRLNNRRTDGKRYICVPGSKNGLFIPRDIDEHVINADVAASFGCDTGPTLILTPEGPTDAAAAHAMGFDAIGRPSNSGGVEELKQFFRTSPPRDVVVVADYDPPIWIEATGLPYWPGWEGALRVTQAIVGSCEQIRVVNARHLPGVPKQPPHKIDLRSWVKDYQGTAAILNDAIADAKPATDAWLAERIAELEQWRRGLAKSKAKEKAA